MDARQVGHRTASLVVKLGGALVALGACSPQTAEAPDTGVDVGAAVTADVDDGAAASGALARRQQALLLPVIPPLVDTFVREGSVEGPHGDETQLVIGDGSGAAVVLVGFDPDAVNAAIGPDPLTSAVLRVPVSGCEPAIPPAGATMQAWALLDGFGEEATQACRLDETPGDESVDCPTPAVAWDLFAIPPWLTPAVDSTAIDTACAAYVTLDVTAAVQSGARSFVLSVDASDSDVTLSLPAREWLADVVVLQLDVDVPSTETACSGGVDEDRDGAFDCADADCAVAPECVLA